MVATVRNLTSSSATVEYFRYEAGYYVGSNGDAGALRAKREEHREASAWHGSGLAALGLKPGAAGCRRGPFEKLLQGHVPGTEIRLGRLRHGGHERRPAFDLTFSAPKSVLLAALLPTERHPRGDPLGGGGRMTRRSGPAIRVAEGPDHNGVEPSRRRVRLPAPYDRVLALAQGALLEKTGATGRAPG